MDNYKKITAILDELPSDKKRVEYILSLVDDYLKETKELDKDDIVNITLFLQMKVSNLLIYKGKLNYKMSLEEELEN